MARYTTEFGNLIDTNFQPLLDCLASYPLFDNNHRTELNEKIIGRYRFREIGFETAARFVHYFKQTLAEIMPYYNKLYEVQAKKFDPLTDADYTETGTANSDSTSTSNSTTGSKNVHLYSDTPQGGFKAAAVDATREWKMQAETDIDTADETVNADYKVSNVQQGKADPDMYLSDASVDTGTTATGSKMQNGATGRTSKTVKGKFPGRTYSEMLQEYRKAVWNIDAMILDDLNTCFMGVY